MGNEYWEGKHYAFFAIGNASIFLAIRPMTRTTLIVCSVIALCIYWGIVVEGSLCISPMDVRIAVTVRFLISEKVMESSQNAMEKYWRRSHILIWRKTYDMGLGLNLQGGLRFFPDEHHTKTDQKQAAGQPYGSLPQCGHTGSADTGAQGEQ